MGHGGGGGGGRVEKKLGLALAPPPPPPPHTHTHKHRQDTQRMQKPQCHIYTHVHTEIHNQYKYVQTQAYTHYSGQRQCHLAPGGRRSQSIALNLIRRCLPQNLLNKIISESYNLFPTEKRCEVFRDCCLCSLCRQ